MPIRSRRAATGSPASSISPQAEIDYVANHYIYLDHDERVAVSAGASYLWQGTRFGGDLIYGSGLRASQHLATPVVDA